MAETNELALWNENGIQSLTLGDLPASVRRLSKAALRTMTWAVWSQVYFTQWVYKEKPLWPWDNLVRLLMPGVNVSYKYTRKTSSKKYFRKEKLRRW